VKERLNPTYADVRGLLQQAGYNFITATGLCNIVSGISVSLFKPRTAVTVKNRKTKKKEWWYTDSEGAFAFLGTGELFKVLLMRYYPWNSAEDGADKAKVVYDFVRNPLAHALGEDKKPGYKIHIRKCKKSPHDSGKYVPWTDAELTEIERTEARPANLSLAVDGTGKTWEFRVEPFYWGIFQLLRRLAKDAEQMTEAQVRFAHGEIVWHK
jgi:hypothetical protein